MRRAWLAAHADARREGATILEAQLRADRAARGMGAYLTKRKRAAAEAEAAAALGRWRDRHGYTRGGRHVPPRAYTTGLRLPQHNGPAADTPHPGRP